MNEKQLLNSVDAACLAEALPTKFSEAASKAAERVVKHLHKQQQPKQFKVLVCDEAVSIPHRLNFASGLPGNGETDTSGLICKCLESRSNDGYQRQRAVQEILGDVQPWSAPFIIALIGEYVIEIMNDIDDSLTPEASAVLAEFVCANPRYWKLTQQRVASYWNAYYRKKYSRSGYVGFKLIETVSVAVRSLP